MDNKSRRGVALWTGAVVLALAAIGAVALLLLRRPESAPIPVPVTVSSARAAGIPSATPEMVTVTTPPVVTLAPTAIGDAPPEAGSAAGGSAKSFPQGLGSPTPGMAKPVGVGAVAAARATPPVKPSAQGDDIPALR